MVEKGIKFLLFCFILFFSFNVFAYDYDVTNLITAPTGTSTAGRYLGLEIYNSGSQNNYAVNTRYNGTLSEIIYNLPLPSTAGQCFTTNMDYTITMEMATQDWRNHFTTPFVSWYSGGTNWKSSNVTFVSMKKIYFKFKIPSSETSCVDFVYVKLRSPSVSNTAFTGDSNWNLSKVTLTDGYTSSGGSSGSGGSGGSNVDPNQSVIDNNNENTTDIIDNANQNTQDIINNQNELLGNTCSNLFDSLMPTTTYCGITATKNSDGTYTFNGTATCNADFRLNQSSRIGVDNLITLDSGTYVLSTGSPIPSNTAGVVMQNSTWDIVARQSGNTSSVTFTVNNSISNIFIYFYVINGTTLNNYVVKPILVKGTSIIPYCKKGTTSSKLDDTNNALNNLNDSLNNSNIDNGTGSDFFNNFTTSDNGGISAIVTKPLTIINSLLDNNNQCASLSLPSFMGVSNATLPSGCILWNNASAIMITLWNTFVCGLGSYFILKDIFRIIEDLKNPDNDKVEVMDL